MAKHSNTKLVTILIIVAIMLGAIIATSLLDLSPDGPQRISLPADSLKD